MSLKSLIAPRIAEHILSSKRLEAKRHKSEGARVRSGEDHIVEFFHDPSDPYSQLLHQVISEIESRYAIRVKTHLVSPPDKDAAPESDLLKAYSKIDAKRLANKAGLNFSFRRQAPNVETEEADGLRKKLGHYLGATLYYGGEWYWGLDRLHYLETRLAALGLAKPDVNGVIFDPPRIANTSAPIKLEPTPVIHFYYSFRSPYSAISISRIIALANAYGAELKPRFVLPMVMRGLPVPKDKGKYIIHDTAREARRLDIPFGRICDPLGKPVERGYSLMAWAREQGKEIEFIKSFLTLVWSQGTDAGSDHGMRKIVEAAGLPWDQARSVLGNSDWKEEAEANRLEMMEHQVWGVPSFRLGDTITWGQDRMWVIEDALKALSEK